ncbi:MULTISPECIES: hypothetical protein [Tenacibaculum]|uniref:hypothetical protein n=1 Tax=Tenacibaculum TaxID=104267 RepID=UPI001BE91254|nr:hypothetical protein [Tenacibaculum finnmarkense]MCD8412407.1 hypothetical protein [Tenacibaculum finnmarkense genomovar ulcerans]MCD8435659.1 hypothetical protein [Tenacibaculum dicentrarchi]MCD8438046.1 hypothetical protein [Tenacibaculum dicentrarchi]MCD8443091.1 hypothetical protein [Tenacibaculum dicentrarchi]
MIEIKINRIKISAIILVIGAVLACSAPFIHMIFPNTKNTELEQIKKDYKKGRFDREEYIIRKKEVTYFGYENLRKFWYSTGKPITMLYFSIMILYASFYINVKEIKKSLKITSILGVLISFYFIIWAFWYRADFPKELYYLVIGVVSILSTIVSYNIIKSRNQILNKIKLLTNHIVFKGKKHVPKENKKEYVKDYLETFNKLVD